MIVDPARANPMPSNRKSGSSRWRAFVVALIVILALGSAKPNTAVRAAPAATPTADSFFISTTPIPNPACAHSLYSVGYFAQVETVADLNGQKTNLEGGFGPPFLSVTGTSSDSSVATLSPSSNALSGLIGQGVTLRLKTEAPGSATLTFAGSTLWRGHGYILPLVERSITVVNCRFKISIVGASNGSADNRFINQVYTATGEIGGNPDAELTGKAKITWNESQVGDCYTATVTISPSSANLEGGLGADGGTLTVFVDFDPILVYTQVQNCGGFSGSGQGQLQPAPFIFTVPITGGVVSRPISLPNGPLTLTGTAIITVVPVEGK